MIAILLLASTWTIEYKTDVEWQYRQLPTHKAAYDFEGLLYNLECESYITTDHKVYYRCKHWKSRSFKDEKVAENFEKTLEILGFKTRKSNFVLLKM